MFEFIVLTVDLMKHLKAFCRIGRNRSGDLRSLFFLPMKVIKFRKFLPFNEIFEIFEIFMSSLSKRIFFRSWVFFVSQYT